MLRGICEAQKMVFGRINLSAFCKAGGIDCEIGICYFRVKSQERE